MKINTSAQDVSSMQAEKNWELCKHMKVCKNENKITKAI